jgi:hypothetical protein
MKTILSFPAWLPMFATRNRTMKTRNNCKITIAVLAAALLVCGNHAQAGSKKPNPTALAKAAAASSEASRVVEGDVHMLLTRLAKGDGFTREFDQAAYKKDAKQLTKLIQQAGKGKSTMTVEGVESDMRVRIRACWDGICITVTISW